LKATIIECPIGILVFDEKNNLIEKSLFPKSPGKAAEKLNSLEKGKLIEELQVLVRNLKDSGYESFVVESEALAKILKEEFNVEAEIIKPAPAGEYLRQNLEEVALNLKFFKKPEEFKAWIHNVTVELTKLKVREAVEKRDLLIIQAIQTIDDIDKTTNLFMGRIREWYGLHFPELGRLVEKHETYARIILEIGERENFSIKKLAELGVPERRAEKIIEAAEKSMGAAFRKEDFEKLRAICKTTLELYERRKELEKYVEEAMDEVAPNVKALVGALLGARLIALAGSLENLAKMPASTIQVLGAEKALFRALRTGSKPPKHGVIFQHTCLREAKRWQRGKIARALAGKLAIAARTDAYSGKFIGDELKTSLEKRIEEIKEKYSEPPQKVYRPSKPKKKKKRRKKHGRS